MLLTELLFTEAMVSVEQAKSQGLVLLVSNDKQQIMLVDPRLTKPSLAAVYGVIDVYNITRQSSFLAVEASAAKPGYGPLLYEVAMALHPDDWLTSDVESVTAQAKAVWQKFYERKDVRKKFIPTFKHHNSGDIAEDKKNPLLYAFQLKSPPDISPLLGKDRFSKMWLELGTEFFRQRYRDRPYP